MADLPTEGLWRLVASGADVRWAHRSDGNPVNVCIRVPVRPERVVCVAAREYGYQRGAMLAKAVELATKAMEEG